MEKINSSVTLLYKTAFPTLWFGMLALFITDMLRGTEAISLASIGFIAILALAGLGVMSAFLFDLAGEVWDHGDYLIVRRGRKEQQVFLTEIKTVSDTRLVNPRRIVLRLVRAGKFGREIAFIPGDGFFVTLNPFARSSIAEDLSERVEAARRRHNL